MIWVNCVNQPMTGPKCGAASLAHHAGVDVAVRGALIALATVMMSLQAMALDATACQSEQTSGDDVDWTGAVTDMGQGFVMQSTGQERVWAHTTQTVFTHCASGQTLQSVLVLGHDQDPNAHPVNPFEVMRDALAADQSFTLADVAAQINAAGGDASLSRATVEACGCAVFYPDQRGTKTAWSSQ